MEGKGKISDYRSRLDKTLSSPDLTDNERLRALVKNQISDFHLEGCIENVVERRSKEVSDFLSMLRSASGNDGEITKSGEESHLGWKLKQDTEELRVMYREGPEGTPFHTLLVEGYVDGPLDVCMCISWESGLYNKWWPQTAIPTFKVISSQCIQRVRTGEQISLLRMKVSWPLSSRETLLHYFTFEYLEHGLMVVLLNSISDSETIDKSTHGFNRDRIPDAEEVVRIDVVGGFALQKVTADRSYFRTIANVDIKLDFVPLAFINFISRQLIGSGFKLYKKEVASVSKGDKIFHEALKDPLYACIREAGNSVNSQDLENLTKASIMLEDQSGEACEDDDIADQDNRFDDSITISEANDVMSRDRNNLEEIEEFQERNEPLGNKYALKPSKYSQITNNSNGNKMTQNCGKKMVGISPVVEQALQKLEYVISVFRELNSDPEKRQPGKNLSDLDKNDVEESNSSEADQTMIRDRGPIINTNETSLSTIVPASKDENQGSSRSNSNHISSNSSTNQTVAESYSLGAGVSDIDANKATISKKEKARFSLKEEKARFCCFRFRL